MSQHEAESLRPAAAEAMTPRKNFLVMYDPYCTGVSPEDTFDEAAKTLEFYQNARHQHVAIYQLMGTSQVNLALPPKQKAFDSVNRPMHYVFPDIFTSTGENLEVIEVCQSRYPADPLLWQATAYLLRAPFKGQFIEDLKKAVWYIQRRIKTYEKTGQLNPPLCQHGPLTRD